jgi:NAD(P)H-hydrate epimerase
MPKWGHVALPGAAKVGELVIADIGIPKSVTIPEGVELVTPDWVHELLPPRPIDANKGTFGKALIVAGSTNYTGAAILAARAAVRAGTGLVTLATPSLLHAAIVPAVPEATYLLLPHTLGIVNARAVSLVRECASRYSAMLIGPGLGNTAESHDFLADLLKGSGRKRSTGFVRDEADTAVPAPLPPLVLDADGLNILATMPDWASQLPGDTVLTPHPGEMSRMTGLTIDEIQASRLEIAQTWAKAWKQVVVLKGAFTVVAGPDRQPAILPFANSGLASAGTGDVLAGTIIALRAQGLDAFDAAIVGCYLHGLAGEIAAAQHGTAGMAAGDVADGIAKAWHRLTSRA